MGKKASSLWPANATSFSMQILVCLRVRPRLEPRPIDPAHQAWSVCRKAKAPILSLDLRAQCTLLICILEHRQIKLNHPGKNLMNETVPWAPSLQRWMYGYREEENAYSCVLTFMHMTYSMHTYELRVYAYAHDTHTHAHMHTRTYSRAAINMSVQIAMPLGTTLCIPCSSAGVDVDSLRSQISARTGTCMHTYVGIYVDTYVCKYMHTRMCT